MTRADWPLSIDISEVRIMSLDDAGTDRAYWLTRPADERFAAVEFLRQQYQAYDATSGRLSRLLKVVPLGTD